jgi:hypothetical protein
LKKESDGYLKQLDDIFSTDLKVFNELVVKLEVGGVVINGIE